MRKFRLLQSNITSVILFLTLALAVNAQNAGSLDQTFGSGGSVSTPINTTATIYDMAIQPDKKIVVVGLTFPPQVQRTLGMVARFNENGTLDTTFNGTGYNALIGLESANSVKLLPDGKIIVGGRGGGGNFDQFSISRLNANGLLDTTFDGDGVAVTTVGLGSEINSVNVLPDGKIIAAGFTALQTFTNRDYAMVKYNSDGSLDTTFGTNGRVATELGSSESVFSSVIQNDGKILVAGDFTDTLANQSMATVVRYNSNGSIDTSFGNSGKIFSTTPGNSKADEIILQPDGKFIIVGDGTSPIRFNSNGTLDFVFNTPLWTSTSSIAIQSDGKIIVGGTASQNNTVARYNVDGTLDSSFGSNGIISGVVYPVSIRLAPDAKFVIGGRGSGSSGGSEIVLTRRLNNLFTGSNRMDYDGDGRADISVFRPSNGGWYISNSSNNSFFGTTFGQNGDAITPADFDGDGKTDISIFRDGNWYRLNSSNGAFTAVNFGLSTDLPVPADFDGDGKADLNVFRPSNGVWYRLNSSNGAFVGTAFGIAEDKPVIGDFDGDAKADVAIFRPSNGTWYRLNSSNGSFAAVGFGITEDKPVTADYDGDGKSDIAVFRPSNGVWYRLNSSNGAFVGTAFGANGDLPSAADFDGDGKADIAVFRPSDGTWYQLRSTSGFSAQTFGTSGDVPTPNAFVR